MLVFLVGLGLIRMPMPLLLDDNVVVDDDD